jgi:predicted  nucleic acid-binding Zn-ribbon protein
VAAGIDPVWLRRYERIFAKQRDAAIARVEHGTCGSCHMKLSPAQIVDARKTDTLTLCDFCGRMLYLAS